MKAANVKSSRSAGAQRLRHQLLAKPLAAAQDLIDRRRIRSVWRVMGILKATVVAAAVPGASLSKLLQV